MEQWKEIKGYEGLYWVSDQGRVKNRHERIIKSRIDRCGYCIINLHKYNEAKTFKVHRLVALAFIPEFDPEKNQVNHISEIKTDNSIDNLEWCTAKYNSNYGTRPEKISINKSKKVLCIETGEIFNCAIDAAFKYKMAKHSISRAARGERKTAAGFHWQYID